MEIPSLSRNPAVDIQRSQASQAERLQQAAEGFEALFMQQMMQSARKSSLGEDLLSSSGQDHMRAMLDQKLTEVGAGRSNLGIARALYQQFAAAAGLEG